MFRLRRPKAHPGLESTLLLPDRTEGPETYAALPNSLRKESNTNIQRKDVGSWTSLLSFSEIPLLGSAQNLKLVRLSSKS
jgi:hypothetical protein